MLDPLLPDLRFRRLAIVGAHAPHRSEDAIARAARRLGLDAKCFDALRTHRRLGPLAGPLLERAIERFAPDFILCTRHAWRIGLPRLARLLRGRRSAFWFFDAISHEGVLELGQLCDVMYTTYANQRGLWHARGVPTMRWLPQALDPDLEQPPAVLRPEDRCDASFIGSGQYPHRWPMLVAVAAACDLRIWGAHWDGAPAALRIEGGPVVGSRFAEVVGASAVSLGANAVPAQDTEYASASDRMWKIFGCGGAYVGPWVNGIETMAEHGVHCRWYRSTEECVAEVRELVAQPEERAAMAVRGRLHALAHHTYDDRLRLLLADQEMPFAPPIVT
ncbi:MAG: glycosyltransferase family 1 protein [Gemmatimonadetes bacterium]|nr:glycosyltransferase family 1 protein [Gemmatimonadota bacterium]